MTRYELRSVAATLGDVAEDEIVETNEDLAVEIALEVYIRST